MYKIVCVLLWKKCYGISLSVKWIVININGVVVFDDQIRMLSYCFVFKDFDWVIRSVQF